MNDIPSVCICHILFIHSSVDRHLGCSHTLAILNNAALDTEVFKERYLFNLVFLFSLGKYQEVELLDHLVALFILFFEEPQYYFSLRLHHFIFPPTVEGLPFSPHFCHLLFLVFLMIAILTHVRWYFIVVLIFVSLMMSVVGYLFNARIDLLYVFFGKILIQILCPFFNQTFFDIELFKFFTYFGY